MEEWSRPRARELASHCRAIVIAVYDGAQVEALFSDIESGPARPAIICTTTCAPDEIIRLAGRAASAGIPFIEAPISGTSAEVRDGTATALVAGEACAIDAVDALLDILCSRSVRGSERSATPAAPSLRST